MSQFKFIFQRVAAVALWLITIALGIADIYYLREIFFGVYALLSRDAAPALFWGNIIVVLGAIAAVGFILWSSEYHRKRIGKHESWDLFAWTLVVELAIPFIAIFLGGSV